MYKENWKYLLNNILWISVVFTANISQPCFQKLDSKMDEWGFIEFPKYRGVGEPWKLSNSAFIFFVKKLNFSWVFVVINEFV